LNNKETADAQKRNVLVLTPLAIPMLAGPGSIVINCLLPRSSSADGYCDFFCVVLVSYLSI
jgi:small neutral amino acid transporter SnatA (MarC family)